jgi:hypothetical protein
MSFLETALNFFGNIQVSLIHADLLKACCVATENLHYPLAYLIIVHVVNGQENGGGAFEFALCQKRGIPYFALYFLAM